MARIPALNLLFKFILLLLLENPPNIYDLVITPLPDKVLYHFTRSSVLLQNH